MGRRSISQFAYRLASSVALLTLLPASCAGTAAAQDTSAAQYTHAESLLHTHRWDDALAILQPLLNSAAPTPKILNLTGLAFVGRGDPKQAATYFEQALKLQPDFVPALKNLGIDEVGLRQLQAAQAHLQAAERQTPDDPVVHLYLGEIAYEQQEFKTAVEHLHRAPGLVSRSPEVLSSLAVSELKIGDRQAALAALDAMQPSGLSPHTQLLVGVTLAKDDLCERALPYLEAARDADRASEGIGYDLALCYLSVKRYPAVISTLEALIGQGHESAETDSVLAEAYEGNRETQAAVGALRRAIALNPEDEDNYLAFASLCMDHQAFEDAGKVLTVGLTVHPGSARLLFQRGLLNAMQDHFDLAEADFQRSAELAPRSNSAYIGLGVTFMETGKAAQAIPMLRRQLQTMPDDANLCYLLGEALLRTGPQIGDPAFSEARTYLEKAVRLGPGLVEPHISLGTIYLRQERFAEAVDQLEQARHIDPRSKPAYSHLAVAYRRLGQQEKSKAVLMQLKDINDQERIGPRLPRNSEEAAPTLPTDSGPNGPRRN